MLNSMKFCFLFFAASLVCCTGIYHRDNLSSKDIVIVNVGINNRIGIAKEIEFIETLNPAVVAIDVQFSTEHNEYQDSLLIASLNRCRNLVLSVGLEGIDSATAEGYDRIFGTLPKFLGNAKIGYVNVLLDGIETPVLRRFNVYERIGDMTMFHFAVQTAMSFDSIQTMRFINTHDQTVGIEFIGNKEIFKVFSADDALNGVIPRSEIEGKIVLIGYLGPYENFFPANDDDKFFTPLNPENPPKEPDMYGVIYLANVIAQILR